MNYAPTRLRPLSSSPALLPMLVGALFLLALQACSEPGDGTQEPAACVSADDCEANQLCVSAECACAEGFSDCDGDPANGCEREGVCPCTLGETRSCYDGPSSTLDVGPCRGGTQSCTAEGWGPCEGQVLPELEGCQADSIDNNCNGISDERPDEDQDGYSPCDGDCCDSVAEHCADNPALVNPGAYDFPDNDVDDDCDGQVDNAPTRECSPGQKLNGATAVDLARAMELCQNANPDGTGWGLLSAELTNVDGSASPHGLHYSILNALGSTVDAQMNDTMVVLSSGRARGVGDPGFVANDTSFTADTMGVGNSRSAPSNYLSAHGGQLETVPQCPAGNAQVNDSVRLRVRMKAPTNAQGMQFKFRFFSYEYPVYLCTEFNDFFLVLVDSQHEEIPTDRNISFDANGAPVSVNNAFFTSCEPLQCFQGQSPDDASAGFGDEGSVSASGMDADGDGCPDSLVCNPTTNLCESQYGACPAGSDDVLAYHARPNQAGATAWLTTSSPVVPGEVVTVGFHIWDTSDTALDSLVLIDDFQWLIEPTEVVTKF